jgi:hypothetical protein
MQNGSSSFVVDTCWQWITDICDLERHDRTRETEDSHAGIGGLLRCFSTQVSPAFLRFSVPFLKSPSSHCRFSGCEGVSEFVGQSLECLGSFGFEAFFCGGEATFDKGGSIF